MRPPTRRSAPPATERSAQGMATTRSATRCQISTVGQFQCRSQCSSAMMFQCKSVTMFQLKCLNRFLTKYLEKFVMVDMLEEVEDLEVWEEAMDLLVALVEDLVVGLAFRIDH